MNIFFRIFTVVTIFSLLISCQEDEPVIIKVPVPSDSVGVEVVKIDIQGVIQKGPFINGTSITVAELDDSLSATGKTFLAQVSNNQGQFATEQLSLSSRYVQLMANGFYYDEVKGEKSAAPLILYALTHLGDTTTVNVNLLSHLTRDRILYLYRQGNGFAKAKQQAQQEVLSLFGIIKTDVASAELLDIAQNGDDNAILLAISAILQADNTVAELSELLANILTDIKEDGKLDNETLQQQIREQGMRLDLPAIRSHLVSRYQEIDVQANIPNFEQYIDSDGDGILNKEEDDTPEEIAFTVQKEVAIQTKIFSEEVTIQGLKAGGASEVRVTHAGLWINGELASDSVARVSNGDKIKLQVLSSNLYADTVVASVSMGYLTSYFTVITDDYRPDDFSFVSQKDVAVDSAYTSNTITVSGIPYGTPAQIEGGTLIRNGIVLTTDTTTVQSGDQLAIRLQSSSQYAGKEVATLNINGVSSVFTLTTDDYQPDAFSFTTIENAKRDSVYTSNTVTLSGLPHPTPISIDQGTLLINGQQVASSEAIVSSGDQVTIILPSSSEYETVTSSFITIGGGSKKFTITTLLNPWQRKADAPHGRAVVLNDKIYVIDLLSSTIHIYDPDQDIWFKKITVFPFEKQYDVCFTIGNKAYYGLGGDYSTKSIYRDFWEYDPVTNKWTRKADFPGDNVLGSSEFSIAGKGYIGTGTHSRYIQDDSGYDGNNDALYLTKDLWEYDPHTDKWTQKANYPGTSKTNATSFVITGKGYIAAGNTRLSTPQKSDELYEYDPQADQWIRKASIKEAQYAGISTSCVVGDKAYVTFWYDMQKFQMYDSEIDIWTVLEDALFPSQDRGFSILSINGKIYAFQPFFRESNHPDYLELWEFTPPVR